MVDSGRDNDTQEKLLGYLERAGLTKDCAIYVDADLIEKETVIDDLENATAEHLNSWVVSCLIVYRRVKSKDRRLMEDFKEDFEGWTPEAFRRLERGIRRELREYLERYGIYFGKYNAPINTRLAALVTATDLPKWDEQDLIDYQDLDRSTAAYQQRERLLSRTTIPAQPMWQQPQTQAQAQQQPRAQQQVPVIRVRQQTPTPTQAPAHDPTALAFTPTSTPYRTASLIADPSTYLQTGLWQQGLSQSYLLQ